MARKKSKKPYKFLTAHSFGVPTNVAVGPLGFRTALEVSPKGERKSRSYHGLDRPDSTAILDGNNPEPSRIVIREGGSETQDPLAPDTSTAVAIHDIEQGYLPTSE